MSDSFIFSFIQAIQGSLELDDRYQHQAAKLENSLKVTTRSFDLKKEVEAYKEQVIVAILKKDEADLKRKEAEESLRTALEANSNMEERIKALEVDLAGREKAAFERGQVEAQTTMTNQLPDVYNEAFQQGWKALYSWPESKNMPELPPRENLPYPNAPISVPDEEFQSPCPSQMKERPVHPSFEDPFFFFFLLFFVDL